MFNHLVNRYLRLQTKTLGSPQVLVPMRLTAYALLTVCILVSSAFFSIEATIVLLLLCVASQSFLLRRQQKDIEIHAIEQESLNALTNALLTTNKDCIKILTRDARIELINDSGLRLLEAESCDQLIDSDWLHFFHGVDYQNAKNAWENALKNGYGEFCGTCSTFNGKEKYWSNIIAPVQNDQGVIEHMLVVSRDSSKSYAHQLSLLSVQNELRLILNSLGKPLIATDLSANITFTNSAAQSLFLVDESRISNSSIFSVLPHWLGVDHKEWFEKALKQSHYRFKRVCNPEQTIWFDIELYPKPQGLNIFMYDVSRQIKEDQAKKRDVARADMVKELESIGEWELDLATNKLEISDQTRQILGLGPVSGANAAKLIRSLIFPADKMKLTRALLDVTRKFNKQSLIISFNQPSGDYVSVHIAMRCLQHSDKAPCKIIGSIRDVTQQKARETYLSEAESFVRGVINALSEQICVINSDGFILMVNKSWEESAESAGAFLAEVGKGQNYISVCEQSAHLGCHDASLVLQGIKDVKSGALIQFSHEYLLPVGAEEKWYRVSITRHQPPSDQQSSLIVIAHDDISTQKHLTLSNEQQSKRLSLISEGANDGSWDWDAKTGQSYYSMRFAELMQVSVDQLIDFHHWLPNKAHPDDLRTVLNSIDEHLHEQHFFDVNCRFRLANNQYNWFRLRGKASREQGKVIRLSGSLMDIQSQKDLINEIAEREKRFTEMTSSMPNVFWDYHIENDQFLYVSPAYEKIWGRAVNAVVNTGLTEFIKTVFIDDREKVIVHYKSLTINISQKSVEYRIIDNHGSIRWISSRSFPVHENGEMVRIVGTATDISEKKCYQEEIKRVSHFDGLTGLPNRLSFIGELHQRVIASTQANSQLAVAFIGIDRFKHINDTMGPNVGDFILAELATRLRMLVPVNGYLARFGGNEFALIFPIASNKDQNYYLPNKVLQSFSEPVNFDKRHLFLTASIGVSFYPNDADTAEQLTANADLALDEAKKIGGSNYQLFNADTAFMITRTLEMENDLRKALENDEFELFYQAKVDCHSARVLGCEGLLRWKHREQGIISPAEFIPLLEQNGMIVAVGDWVLKTGLAQLKKWHEAGFECLSLSLNVSPRQMAEPDFIDRFRTLLAASQVTPNSVELEITESTLMIDPIQATRFLEELKAMGVSVAIDDFGTGYSSLSHLRRFAPNTLKVDKSFIDEIETESQARSLLEGIIELSKRLGIKVVAEGVENAQQWAILVEVACDQLQGYYFAKPLPAERFFTEKLNILSSQENNLTFINRPLDPLLGALCFKNLDGN